MIYAIVFSIHNSFSFSVSVVYYFWDSPKFCPSTNTKLTICRFLIPTSQNEMNIGIQDLIICDAQTVAGFGSINFNQLQYSSYNLLWCINHFPIHCFPPSWWWLPPNELRFLSLHIFLCISSCSNKTLGQLRKIC